MKHQYVLICSLTSSGNISRGLLVLCPEEKVPSAFYPNGFDIMDTEMCPLNRQRQWSLYCIYVSQLNNSPNQWVRMLWLMWGFASERCNGPKVLPRRPRNGNTRQKTINGMIPINVKPSSSYPQISFTLLPETKINQTEFKKKEEKEEYIFIYRSYVYLYINNSYN